MNEEPQPPNPFASPEVAVATAIPDFDPDTEIREFHLGKSLVRWLVICIVSAAPSFFWGMALADDYAIQSVAMLLGILTFVALYVFIESREWTRRKLTNRSIRLAVNIGYISRIVISVIYPVAMILDMICGMFSVGLVSELFGYGFGLETRYEETEIVAWPYMLVWFYFTTLVQGVFLNIVLGGYTMLVYAFALLFHKRR
ncbi:hypothetical protein [Mariniblastus fucicola]|uniref:Uncharacterized protein n=1 Tax=Mariniblastus fucicola TaxID=980251 RepID=A0A5B9PDZ5_9BACT|nr:hypothetical protein [Mariniblastus fucicola]QEG24628.1 hypothetical protein MFFC18_45490 [Mariniblastus fucicola]